jgi:hypothetical protein
MPVFEQLGPSGTPFLPRNQDAFDLLGRVTAVDKGLSQPYLKLWRVKPDGSPFDPSQSDPFQPSRTVSILLVEPPTFGSSVDRYPERAAVSLEKVSVKNNFQLGGPILYRELVLDFVVHRPELVFDESNQDYDQWSALILPGAMFALRYGWTGSSGNDIMNGSGIADASNVVEGQKTVLFVVTRYNFTINQDGSISFTVMAHENADNVLNHVSMADLDYFVSPNVDSQADVATYAPGTAASVKEFETQTGTALVRRLQQDFHGLNWQTTKRHGRWVKLQEVLDVVFAPLMDRALRSVGYSNVRLFVGSFNEKLGLAKEELGGDLHGKSIGEFQLPERWLKDALGQLRASGAQMNLYNFFQQLLSFVMSPENWQQGLTDDEKEAARVSAGGNKKQQAVEEARILSGRQSPPEVKVKTTSTSKDGRHTAYVYIYDMKRAHVAVDTSDRLDPRTTRDQIVQKLQKYGIPLVTFKHGLSFVQSAQFQAEQDQQIQAVLISRAVDPSRYQVANVTHAARAAETIDPRKLLFSSAVQGKVTMLGNFVFDSFQMVWLEFGVRRWDGTFFVFEKEDVVDRTGFFSTVTFRSTGDDPLNTQGVLRADQHRSS